MMEMSTSVDANHKKHSTSLIEINCSSSSSSSPFTNVNTECAELNRENNYHIDLHSKLKAWAAMVCVTLFYWFKSGAWSVNTRGYKWLQSVSGGGPDASPHRTRYITIDEDGLALAISWSWFFVLRDEGKKLQMLPYTFAVRNRFNVMASLGCWANWANSTPLSLTVY